MTIIFDLLDNHPKYINQLRELYWNEWSISLKKEFHIEHFYEYNLCNKNKYYIALENENLIGSIALSPADLDDTDTHVNLTPWLSYVYILSEYRNKGISSLMIKWFLEKEKIRPMYLWCKPYLETFYKKFGAEIIEKREDITIMIIL